MITSSTVYHTTRALSLMVHMLDVIQSERLLEKIKSAPLASSMKHHWKKHRKLQRSFSEEWIEVSHFLEIFIHRDSQFVNRDHQTIREKIIKSIILIRAEWMERINFNWRQSNASFFLISPLPSGGENWKQRAACHYTWMCFFSKNLIRSQVTTHKLVCVFTHSAEIFVHK